MAELLISFAALLLSGVAASALRARAGVAHRTGQAGAVIGSLLGLAAAIGVLLDGIPTEWGAPWPMPGGGLHIAIDSLSANFLLPIFSLSALTGVYGRSYLTGRDRDIGSAASWLYLNVLTSAMALVVVARAYLFQLPGIALARDPAFRSPEGDSPQPEDMMDYSVCSEGFEALDRRSII